MQEKVNAKLTANLLSSELSGILSKNNLSFADNPISANHFAALVKMIDKGEVSSKQGKEILNEMLKGEDPESIAKEKGMKQLSDESAILAIVTSVLDDNPQSISDFKNGKDRALGYLVGQVMKRSKGQANPKLANELVTKELAKR